jgi:gliding motility-associated-like protein
MVGNVIDANGCTVAGSGSATVTVNAAATPTLTGSNAVCLNAIETYTTDATFGITDYTWTVVGGTISNGGGTTDDFVEVTWDNGTGPHSVAISYTDINGCITTATLLSVTVVDLQVSINTVTENTFCGPIFNGAISLDVTGASGPVSYSWVSSPSGFTRGNVANPTDLEPEDWEVTVTDVNSGCAVTLTSITVPDNPALLNIDTSVATGNSNCTTPNGAISITVSGAVGTLSYAWSGPSSAPSSPNITGLLEGDYEVIVEDQTTGCTVDNIGTPFVVDNLKPNITLSFTTTDNTICVGTPDGSIDLTINDGGPTYTIRWSVAGTPIPSLDDIEDPTNLAAATYDVLVTDVATTCFATETIVVVDNFLPVIADIGSDDTICEGQSATLEFTLNGTGPTYNVIYTDGTSNFNLTGVASGATTTVTPSITTTYTIVQVTDVSTGCTTSTPGGSISGAAVITVNPLPSASISGTATICPGGSTDLTFSLPAGPDSFQVVYTDGTSNFTLSGLANGSTEPVSPTVTTTYTIVSVTNETTLCTVVAPNAAITGSAVITISGATVNAGTDQTVCQNATIALNGSVGGAATGGTWSGGTGTFNPSPSALNAVYTPGVGETGAVTLTLSTTGPCAVATDDVVITITPVAGDQVTAGNETWIGYVYTDAGDPQPLPGRIDFASSKYRGFIDETDMAAMSGTSSYNTATDAFDMNLASGSIFGPDVCGTYQDDFSVRLRMQKNFTLGTYVFTVGSDDGVRFLIDGVNQITNPAAFTNHPYTTFTTSPICLTGNHTLEIQYYERVGQARLSFNYAATPAVAPATAPSVSVCVGSAPPVLTASTTDPNATGFNWYDAGLNLVFSGASFTPSSAELDMSVTGTTTFTVAAAYPCGDGPSATVAVNVVNSADIGLAVSPAVSPLCTGGSTNIVVANSESGVQYQLRIGTTNVGSPLTGTGANLNLPTGTLTANTTFNVLATAGTCAAVQLTQTATVSVTGTIDAGLAVTATAAALCVPGSTNIEVAASETGVSYQLRDDANDNTIGTPVVGTGATIVLPTGTLSATTTFNILATNGSCSIELTAKPIVTLNNPPDIGLTLTASIPVVCLGGSSAVIVNSPEAGVSYQLREGSTNVGAPVIGAGSSISLPTNALNANTTFNVLATAGACAPLQLNQTITINVGGSVNAGLAVTANPATLCVGGSTNIEVALSEAGVSYQLRNDADNSLIGAAVPGSGATIQLPASPAATTTFNILATSATCSIVLSTKPVVTVNTPPNSTLGVSPVIASLCTGGSTSIIVASSESGVSYQLRDGSTAVGSAVTGTGSNINLPTGSLTATTTFNVLATRGSCAPIQLANTATVTIAGSINASIAASPASAAVCLGTGTTIQLATSESGVSYQLRNNLDNSNIGVAVAGSGSAITLPTGNLFISTTFNILATSGSCSILLTALPTVTILSPLDPLCSGGTGTGLCSTVVIDPVPSAAQCALSDGSIQFNVTPQVPANNPDGVTISIERLLPAAPVVTATKFNAFVFDNIPAGQYKFTLIYGDASNPSCTKEGFVTIDQSGTVGTPTAELIAAPTCSGAANSQVRIDVPNQSGNPFEWSITPSDPASWKPFSSGQPFTGVPAGLAPSFEQIISVRRDASDACFASISLAIQNQFAPITGTITVQQPASCANNDGRALADFSGGDNAKYSFILDGQAFTMPGDRIIRNLTGGVHTLRIIDNQNCTLDITGTDFTIPGPSLIDFAVTKVDPGCNANGTDGKIQVQIASSFLPGSYEVAITQQQGVNARFDPIPASGFFEFVNLVRGRYFVTVRAGTSGCPNEKTAEINAGPVSLAVSAEALCFNAQPAVRLTNISGQPGAPIKVEVFREGVVAPVETISLAAIPAGNTYLITGVPFLSEKGNYTLRLVQTQGACSDLTSPVVNFKMDGAITVQATDIVISLPDLPSGELVLKNFDLGTAPYFSRISLEAATIPGQSFSTDLEEVPLTPDVKFERKYTNLPAGTYRIDVADDKGCAISLAADVPLNTEIFIPNIFTPNGDGVNETFFIRNLPSESVLLITNRWGKEVFTSNNYQNDWNGGGAADGVYFYKLTLQGEVFTGWVEIVRGQ